MALSASRAITVFRACVVNAVREGEALMARLIEATRASLADQEEHNRQIAQRNLLSDALHLLKTHEAALCKAYPMALLELFSLGAGEPAAKVSPAQASGMDFGELALVDDAEITTQVELARAQQLALHASEAALTELNTLVSAAQGLARVQPESNPLRPENYIRALQQVIGETGVPPAVRQLWMQTMGEHLGALLSPAYRLAASGLREHGITPVRYVASGAAGARGGYPAGGSGHGLLSGEGGYPSGYVPAYPGGGYPPGYAPGYPPAGYAPGYGGGVPTGYGAAAGALSAGVPLAPQEAVLTAGILRQMLQGGGDPYAWEAPMSGRPSAGAALTRGAPLSAAAPLSHARVAHDLLMRMMENIALDTRLPPAVQRQVLRLEPALQQLVAQDSDFFADEQHPARRLLDEITQRSLAFEDEEAPAFRHFLHWLDQAITQLDATAIHDAAPFARVLQALEQAWAAQAQREQGLQQAQQRRLRVEQVVQELRAQPGAEQAQRVWLQFLTGPWAEVIVQAQEQTPDVAASDPGGYRALVPVLLASAQPQIAPDAARRLRPALTALLPLVRRGLQSIDYPSMRAAYLIEQLSQLPALPQEPSAPLVAEDDPADALPPAEPAQGEQEAPTTGGGLHASAPAVAGASAGLQLELGQWVQIHSGARAVRTQLTWCSPHQTLFLFTAVDGSTQSMTRRMIDKLAAQGVLKSAV